LAGLDTFAGPLLAVGLVFWIAFAVSGVGWLVAGHIVIGTLVFMLRGVIVVLMVYLALTTVSIICGGASCKHPSPLIVPLFFVSAAIPLVSSVGLGFVEITARNSWPSLARESRLRQ
jgi:hypothetical protein